MSGIGFCIGNGTSREFLDLDWFDTYGITVGCNRIYKTYNPQYLVALDSAMKKEIESLPKPLPWKYITRDPSFSPTSWTCDGVPFGALLDLNGGINNNSGIAAAAFLAQILKVDKLYLIGVDFFQPVPGRDNDLTGGNYPWGGGFVRGWNNVVKLNPACDVARVGPIPAADSWFYSTQLQGFRLIDFEDMYRELDN